MDRVEGLMRGLKLSEAERKGVKIGGAGGDLEKQGAVKVLQAVGKVLAQKPVIADAVANALGPVWCPMKGVSCKELGENIFLFNFYQAGGRKKAVESGPWMFEKDLIVMEEYDPNKTAEQYEFNSIPIWVRMYKLPLGMMKKETGEKLGELVGEFMEMDGVEDGMAFGKCLRVKIRYWARESQQWFCMVKEPGLAKVAERWRAPVGDVIKINCDGAFHAEHQQGGWGFAARDDKGILHGAGAGHIAYVASALQAEAMACAGAVQAAASWGMGHIQLELDSLTLVNALCGSEFDRAPEGILFRDIRSFIQLNFISCEVSFAPRSCNKVAHAMAELGAGQLDQCVIWLDDVPDAVSVLLASESAVPV
ncbi:hypothetical protein ACQ4PT_060704 [Festuca glaucescens]